MGPRDRHELAMCRAGAREGTLLKRHCVGYAITTTGFSSTNLCNARVMERRHRPTLITDAPVSPAAQLRRRTRRYLAMMSFRVVCVVGATVVAVNNSIPLRGLWTVLLLIGMILVPWLAVLLANDRPPRPAARRARPPKGLPRPTQAAVEPPLPSPTVVDV